MNEINQIRLDRLNKIALANDKAKKDIADANEATRLACIKRIREYCVPKYAELLELENAYCRASGVKDSIKVSVGKDNTFLYYPGWHSGANKVGFAVSTSDTSTYYYTVTKDGELWKNCSYGKKFLMNLDEMPYWMAVKFVDGFDKWEQELLRRIDSL